MQLKLTLTRPWRISQIHGLICQWPRTAALETGEDIWNALRVRIGVLNLQLFSRQGLAISAVMVLWSRAKDAEAAALQQVMTWGFTEEAAQRALLAERRSTSTEDLAAAWPESSLQPQKLKTSNRLNLKRHDQHRSTTFVLTANPRKEATNGNGVCICLLFWSILAS